MGAHSKCVLLEYYRGVAALGVAIAHFFALRQNVTAEFWSVFFVEMFFPLSGFVLAPQMIKVYREKRHMKVFLYRRWLRTLPVFLLALLAMILVTKQAHGVWDVVKYALFANFFTPGYGVNNYYPVVWSLAVEEYYYLLFPLFLFVMRGSLWVKTLAFIGLSLLIKLVALAYFDASFVRIATFARLDAIAIGFAFRMWLMEREGKPTIRPAWLAGAALLLVPILGWYSRAPEGVSLLLFLYGTSLFFGFACCMLYQFEARRAVTGALKAPGLFVGKISYSVYLFHPLLMIFATKQNWGFPVYLAALVVLCFAVYKFFEEPILLHRPEYR